MQVRPKTAPAPEAIVWDGTNNAEVFDLVLRVAALHVWSPLEGGVLSYTVNHDDPPHLGLNVARDDGMVVTRVEDGNVLVFDLFAPTPLFVLSPDEFAAFYETGG